MATETTFTADQLKELLGLIKESDSVELKFTVPASHQRATVRGLDLDPLDAQIRQVFFFETPDLALDKLGVVARARRIQGKGDDSVVKLRPVVPASLPEDLRRSAAFRSAGIASLVTGLAARSSLTATRNPSHFARWTTALPT